MEKLCALCDKTLSGRSEMHFEGKYYCKDCYELKTHGKKETINININHEHTQKEKPIERESVQIQIPSRQNRVHELRNSGKSPWTIIGIVIICLSFLISIILDFKFVYLIAMLFGIGIILVGLPNDIANAIKE
jgi:hypothetical protein